jgi:hypothetical protein
MNRSPRAFGFAGLAFLIALNSRLLLDGKKEIDFFYGDRF